MCLDLSFTGCHGLQNSTLRTDFKGAIAQVTQLQELTFQLEGRQQEDAKTHQEVVASRDDEIDVLNEKVGVINHSNRLFLYTA